MSVELKKRMDLQDKLVDKLWCTLVNYVSLTDNNMSKAEILGCFEILKDKVFSTRGASKMDIGAGNLNTFNISE